MSGFTRQESRGNAGFWKQVLVGAGGVFLPLLGQWTSYFEQKPAGPTLKKGISHEESGSAFLWEEEKLSSF